MSITKSIMNNQKNNPNISILCNSKSFKFSLNFVGAWIDNEHLHIFVARKYYTQVHLRHLRLLFLF
jgi:hypothetical protein